MNADHKCPKWPVHRVYRPDKPNKNTKKWPLHHSSYKVTSILSVFNLSISWRLNDVKAHGEQFNFFVTVICIARFRPNGHRSQVDCWIEESCSSWTIIAADACHCGKRWNTTLWYDSINFSDMRIRCGFVWISWGSNKNIDINIHSFEFTKLSGNIIFHKQHDRIKWRRIFQVHFGSV